MMETSAYDPALAALYTSASNAGTTNYLPAVAGAKSFTASSLMGVRGGGKR